LGYSGIPNREMSPMDKQESPNELFAGRHFDREAG
jgi:hypothetical protein